MIAEIRPPNKKVIKNYLHHMTDSTMITHSLDMSTFTHLFGFREKTQVKYFDDTQVYIW